MYYRSVESQQCNFEKFDLHEGEACLYLYDYLILIAVHLNFQYGSARESNPPSSKVLRSFFSYKYVWPICTRQSKSADQLLWTNNVLEADSKGNILTNQALKYVKYFLHTGFSYDNKLFWLMVCVQQVFFSQSFANRLCLFLLFFS